MKYLLQLHKLKLPERYKQIIQQRPGSLWFMVYFAEINNISISAKQLCALNKCITTITYPKDKILHHLIGKCTMIYGTITRRTINISYKNQKEVLVSDEDEKHWRTFKPTSILKFFHFSVLQTVSTWITSDFTLTSYQANKRF